MTDNTHIKKLVWKVDRLYNSRIFLLSDDERASILDDLQGIRDLCIQTIVFAPELQNECRNFYLTYTMILEQFLRNINIPKLK